MTEEKSISEDVKNWPTAAVKAFEILVNRSIIGGIFIVFMYGVYDIGLELLNQAEAQVNSNEEIIKKLIRISSQRDCGKSAIEDIDTGT